MIVDLDDLITKPVGFRFRGHVYRVEPVTAATFMELTEKLSEAGNLVARARAGEAVNEEDIYRAYQEFISVLVPSFKVDIRREMQMPQVHALINLVIKHATGQPMNLDEVIEKKKLIPSHKI